MKTTIEVGSLEIKIEELEGKVTTSFVQNGEVIEEFEFDASGESSDEEGDDEDMMPFGEEEEDFADGEEEMEDDSEEMEDDSEEMEDEEEVKLESFNSFIKRRKK